MELDVRTTEIIAAHFSLEREMELAIDRLVERPGELDRLGFGHKVAVLKALIAGSLMDRLADQLLAFNELRNAAAHPRNSNLKTHVRKLHGLVRDALVFEESGLFSELDAFDEGSPTVDDLMLRPSDAPVITYAAAIAGGLQAVVRAQLLVRAAPELQSVAEHQER